MLRFNFPDSAPPAHTFWLITKPAEPVGLCVHDPGFDVDLYIETEVPVLTGIYLGRRTFDREIEDSRFFMSGDPKLSRTIRNWLKLSQHSKVEGIALASG